MRLGKAARATKDADVLDGSGAADGPGPTKPLTAGQGGKGGKCGQGNPADQIDQIDPMGPVGRIEPIGPVLERAGLAALLHAMAADLNGRGYPVTWVVDRQMLAGDFPLQVVAKVSVVRVLNIALDDRGPAWQVSMGRPSSVRWEQSAVLDLGPDGLDAESVVRAALRALGLPLQRAVYH
ncbi:hypothetical protein [Streptomyces flavofungini]|uniref:hypothetical protein n=1 Tax=Streptomyces flavofungini TaxID=68200 RepID=UPI0025AF3579|nr:hypothetical protein [Streptomyces flavofungini]WJV47301.1 hypothetical protein QUY26_18320 [Streptomyces flavofungini]